MSQLTLHHYWRSSCSWRVRWALELKQIPYQSKPVNLLANEQNDAGFLAKSPMGQVPCIEYQGKVLGDSIAIIEWLDEVFPAEPLLPVDPWSRAKTRELSQLIASGTQPIQNLKVMRHHAKDQAAQRDWARHHITQGLKAYETMIRGTSGSYSLGGQITLADLCLIPQVYNAHRFNVNMGALPLCEAIYQRCLKLPSCAAAAPQNQPGAQP